MYVAPMIFADFADSAVFADFADFYDSADFAHFADSADALMLLTFWFCRNTPFQYHICYPPKKSEYREIEPIVCSEGEI